MTCRDQRDAPSPTCTSNALHEGREPLLSIDADERFVVRGHVSDDAIEQERWDENVGHQRVDEALRPLRLPLRVHGERQSVAGW